MAHKRLRGMRKPKLSKTRKDTKDKKGVGAKNAKERKKLAKMEDAAARSAPAEDGEEVKKPVVKPKVKVAGAPNKKEARKKSALEKMHLDLYAGGERILLVGEGNFSFARALCKHVGSGSGIYATGLDSEADLKTKYPDAAECRKEIEGTLGGTCLTGVDATRIHKIKEFKGAFRKIVFNFPHLGTGEKDVEKSCNQHRQMLAEFFASAVRCLDKDKDCYIHVALKTGEPYRSWKIVQTVRAACPELSLLTAVPFVPHVWEGYAHRRTAGFSDKFSLSASEELAKGAKVYVFRKRKEQAEEAEK